MKSEPGDIWPAMAAWVTWGYGSVGSYGFNNPTVRTRWHEGLRHSDFLTPDFCKKYWVPFLRDGTIIKGSDKPSRLPWTIRAIAKIPLRGIVLLLFLGLLGLGVWYILYGRAITIDLQAFDGPAKFSVPTHYNTTMQSVLNRVYNKIIESDATVGAHKYQKDWILVDANRRPITNIGTEYELECRRVNSDNRLVTEIVAPGSKLTALSCVPGHDGQSIRCPPIDCSR